MPFWGPGDLGESYWGAGSHKQGECQSCDKNKASSADWTLNVCPSEGQWSARVQARWGVLQARTRPSLRALATLTLDPSFRSLSALPPAGAAVWEASSRQPGQLCPLSVGLKASGPGAIWPGCGAPTAFPPFASLQNPRPVPYILKHPPSHFLAGNLCPVIRQKTMKGGPLDRRPYSQKQSSLKELEAPWGPGLRATLLQRDAPGTSGLCLHFPGLLCILF